MRRRLQQPAAGRLRRNIAWMTGATVLGHGLFLLASPILTRLYGLEDFALLGILMTLQALLLAVMSGRIEWSVPAAGGRTRAMALIMASLILLVATSIVLTASVLIWSKQILGWRELENQSRLLLLIFPLSVLATGVQMILHSWCVYEARMKPVALSKFAQSMSFVIFALVTGSLSGLGLFLPLAFALSNILSAFMLIAFLRGPLKELAGLSLPYIRDVTSRFKLEICASLGSSILHSLAFYMPFLMIWLWYDETMLGWFAFVFRIGTAPVSFLGHALAKSFRAEAAYLAERDPERLRHLFLRMIGILSLVAIPFSLMCLAAPLYFGVVFGAEWSGAGAVLAALTPMLVSLLVFSSTNHLIVYHKQHWQLLCDAFSVIVFGGIFWGMAIRDLNPTLTLGVASTAFLASYGLRMYLHLRANTLYARKLTQWFPPAG